MSWLLFLDESGHDRRNTPYEVRGGIALRDVEIWPFVRAMKDLEVACFGDLLHRYRSEIKGHRLLDKDRFAWAAYGEVMDDAARRKHCLAFLNKGTLPHPSQRRPGRSEFMAYGQASLAMAHGVFQTLQERRARLFAIAIPRTCLKPDTLAAEEFLRKDSVFLLERYFYFLEEQDDCGLVVMDETDKNEDRRYVRKLERYFTVTQAGRSRASRIVPSPFFVASDMTYPIQAADVCIYCVNHGFRVPTRGMDAPTRPEIANEFGPWLARLQYKGTAHKDGEEVDTYGIAFVSNPYGAGRA